MIVFPAIDLIAGKVVRLARGERSRMDVYSDDPVAVARDFRERGAEWIHVVDLSATFREDDEALAANAAAMEEICGLEGIRVDAGGGVRSIERLAQLIGMGCERVSIGTALVKDPEFAAAAARDYAEHVVADVAAKGGEVRVDGWREGAGIKAEELVRRLADMGFRHLVFTDVSRDGMRTGVDMASYQRISEAAGFPVVASGGVATLDDIRALAALGSETIEGVITGRAIFEGAFELEDALAIARSAQ
ncbi:MAG: 1-(5-phosphoribosyl)-5-((5-phosphoribosylamino)methylideneamino)imidazole-4-carboxamide isomerase [Atopobiaceae bacterium]|nr:1-(5-phosphoribosyl)-5-((5-phosphoribosylamino)methylideneamino)imidazole-4-carboxamide isomerase [Atopobiaceae bacterium]